MARPTRGLKFESSIELASQMPSRQTICASHVIATSEKAMEVTGAGRFFGDVKDLFFAEVK